MAFTSVGFEAEITFIDQGNDLSKVRVGVGGADIAAAEAIVAANIADWVAVTKAYVQSYSVREVFANGAARTPAGQVEEKAVLTVALTTTPKKGIITIPAPIDAMFGASGTTAFNQVNTANSLVLALVGDYQVGGFSLSDGENVPASGALLAGQRTHRSARH
jgi:hypothetical protein